MVAVMADGYQDAARHRRWRKLAADEEGTLLFETTGGNPSGKSYLFRNPVRWLTAYDAGTLWTLFEELTEALKAGFYAAGLLRYEAAYVFERVRNRPPVREPLAWFGIYREPETSDHVPLTSTSLLPLPLCLSMEMPLRDYLRSVATIKQYIEAGDSYQVNLTTTMQATYQGGVLPLYNALAEQQPAPFSALLHLPENEFVLSFSPELFFSIDSEKNITVRPMKGTAPLGASPEADRKQMEWLAADEKNRAEHLMIVDLLRSDLGRLCLPGSIHASHLFAIERYRTLLQMTSTITGSMRQAVTLQDVFRALFPSGSMTGAPKPRTMEIIAELEGAPRGIYSGAIGFAAPSGAAVFSVPIRTVVLKEEVLRMGVGGGIVADSVAEQEHAECWLKTEFLGRASPSFELFETLLWDGEFRLIDQHLDRLAASAETLNFQLDRRVVLQQLDAASLGIAEPCRVRLVVQRNGHLSITTGKPTSWSKPLHLHLSSKPTWSGDSFLRHKTTFRPLYRSAAEDAHRSGFSEVIFMNERKELTEGAVSNLVLHIEGIWQTPALRCGVLPGIARGELLRRGQICETVLKLNDLERADAVAVCNAVRGVGAVRSIQLSEGRVLRFDRPVILPAFV